MARIQFSTDNTNWYEVPINPVGWDRQDNKEITIKRTPDGGTTTSKPTFDSRVKTFKWAGLPQIEKYISMVNTFKGYEGIGVIYFRPNTIDFGNTNSIRIKVQNVSTTIRDGAGPARSPYKMTWNEIVVSYTEVRL